MGVKITVDDHLLREKIKKLLRKTKKSEKEFVKEQASLLAETVVRATPPFVSYKPFKGSMGTLKDRKQGQSALVKDMNSVFSIKEDGYISYLNRRFGTERNISATLRGKKGNYRVETPLATLNKTTARRYYESKRSNFGRPKSNEKTGWQKAFIDKSTFDSIYKDKAMSLGIAKASFAKAVVSLNPKKRVNKWIKAHFGRVDTSISQKQRKGYSVTISTSAKGLQYITNKINYFSKVRMNMAKRALHRSYRKKIKEVGF